MLCTPKLFLFQTKGISLAMLMTVPQTSVLRETYELLSDSYFHTAPHGSLLYKLQTHRVLVGGHVSELAQKRASPGESFHLISGRHFPWGSPETQVCSKHCVSLVGHWLVLGGFRRLQHGSEHWASPAPPSHVPATWNPSRQSGDQATSNRSRKQK